MKLRRLLNKNFKSAMTTNKLNPKDYDFVENINTEYIKVVNKASGIQKTLKIRT